MMGLECVRRGLYESQLERFEKSTASAIGSARMETKNREHT